MTNTTLIQFKVPVELKDEFKDKAEAWGLDVTNCLRYLMANVVNGRYALGAEQNIIRTATPEEEESIRLGKEDIANGNYTTLEVDDDIESHLDQIIENEV